MRRRGKSAHTREAGKGERWVMAGAARILQLSECLKLLTEMVGKEEVPHKYC